MKMLKVSLTGGEAAVMFNLLESGSNGKGNSWEELDVVIPLKKKITFESKQQDAKGRDVFLFKDQEIRMRISEGRLVETRLKDSTGWSATEGDVAKSLMKKIKEAPEVDATPEESK